MMICSRRNLAAALIFIVCSTSLAAGTAPNVDFRQYLVPEAVSVAQADPAGDVARLLSSSAADGSIRVWVLFTDKGISSKEAFTQKAASVGLTDRARQRRTRLGLQPVLFTDLPVLTEYIESIVSLGGQHRRTSRWLNGASYEVTPDQLKAIAELPYVAAIRPMRTYRRPNSPATELKLDDLTPQALGADVLNYGVAEEQIYQINVPPVHESGFDGTGVTLAIFDTGFRTSHEAFAQHYLEGRVLAEYDFIFDDSIVYNEAEDWANAWNHGTYIWSTSAGLLDGVIYGPAYHANFILCKTEDVRSETQVEEDNWVAALEWVDSLGADVVTSSLSYQDFDDGSEYVFEDLDGWTGISSAAASMAAAMGIVVCNSAGNSGPTPSTCFPPADAHDILTVGAVNGDGDIASFSSRGPVVDDRIKPEVVARGVATACATATADDSYGAVNGTSLSTPLVAGVACLMVQARPQFTPVMIRQALMETADNADAPNNTYGWGLVNAMGALGWGADFDSDTTLGEPPLTVNFAGTSSLTPLSWTWDFGDGDSAFVQNPSHTFTQAGVFDVSLTVGTDLGDVTHTKLAYIALFADTAYYDIDSVWAGRDVVFSVNLTNTQALERIIVPIKFDEEPSLTLDSVSRGMRTTYFELLQDVWYNPGARTYAWELRADNGQGAPPLPPGSGEVIQFHFSMPNDVTEGLTNVVDTAVGSKHLEVTSEYMTYDPRSTSGQVYIRISTRGDVNGDGVIDITDLVYLVTYMFQFGPPPVTPKSSDITADGFLNISDLTYLVEYMFQNGPPPPAK